MSSSRSDGKPLQGIELFGVDTHNLKHIDLVLPRHKLIVITGVSGSGKSSLAFDTLFAEGQRRYLQSLSSYARQFIGKIEKPPAELIRGLPPSIGIQQKTGTHNARARVATTADLYAYLKLLYARAGTTHSPVTGKEVQRDSVTGVVDFLLGLPEGKRVWLLAPLQLRADRSLEETLRIELSKGYTRLLHKEKLYYIDQLLGEETAALPGPEGVSLVVDRFITSPALAAERGRLAESVQSTLYEGEETCTVWVEGDQEYSFSTAFEADGVTFQEPSPHFFDFNNPHGACNTCKGMGWLLGVDPRKVIPEQHLSLQEGAILPWRRGTMHRYQVQFLKQAHQLKLRLYVPYQELSEEEKRIVWEGVPGALQGISQFFDLIQNKLHKVQYRVLLNRYLGYTECMRCRGTGIRPDASYVKLQGKSLHELMLMPVTALAAFFAELQVPEEKQKVTSVLLTEIRQRLHYLLEVGLGYLTLNRRTRSLSGGEYQRIRLARATGSTLMDALYILDEPTIGLHPRDTERLIGVLRSLQQQGNTVVVVEHDQQVMEHADDLIDIGPLAGEDGGRVVFHGDWRQLTTQGPPDSRTVRYLLGIEQIPLPASPRYWKQQIVFHQAAVRNLQIDKVVLPLQAFTVMTGVSGSGKSTLAEEVIFKGLLHYLGAGLPEPGTFQNATGDLDAITNVEWVGQDALGRSSRSNAATYTKAYDLIRKLFAEEPLAADRGYSTSHFSFNMPGGRCEACQGEGEQRIEMQFMADVRLVCEECQGKRFQEGVLEVTCHGKNIWDVLNLTVSEAMKFFADYPAIRRRLLPLQQVGLGYLRLGQACSTLSGGEAQRVKLSSYLGPEENTHPTLFIFDEPTTGLHFHDIKLLIAAFQQLVDKGHTLLVIEHNMDVVKCADWVLDLGPEGGDGGGKLVFTGLPCHLADEKGSHTAPFLKEKFVTAGQPPLSSPGT